MPAQKQAASAHRNIKLGLERISRVVPDEQSWLGVHVGGTNGKGSICALLAGMFKLSGISHGTYISPAIPERHNGVTINGLYVNKRMYEMELQHVEEAYRRVASGWTLSMGEDPGDLTPFELETAAAFRVFNKMHVQYGIVEVGMGGATDATNAMKQKAVTVISKIDLDHQEYLGNTIEEIAKVKAGIMRPGVPCIVDHTNPTSVMEVLRDHAQSTGTQISLSSKAAPLISNIDMAKFPLQDYEQQNLLCATLAFRQLFPNLDIDVNKLLSLKPQQPGRMERVDVSGLTNGLREHPILVDAAHNMLGVEALSRYVEGTVRPGSQAVTWVMGFSSSKSKPFSKMIETLIRPQDNLAFVEYTQGANDPPASPAELGRSLGAEVIREPSQLYDGEPGISPAVQWACEKAADGPVIFTGSLYLIREFYKMQGVEPSRKMKMRRPGRSQLWRYMQLSRERPLTSEEAREFKQARRHWYLSPMKSATFRDVRNGGSPLAASVPDKIRESQRLAAFHKKQADGYRSAIKCLVNDLSAEQTAGGEDASAGSPSLSKDLDDLKRRRDEHLKGYNRAMTKVRGHQVDADKKYASHEEIFGAPEKPKSRILNLLPDEDDLQTEKISIWSEPSSMPRKTVVNPSIRRQSQRRSADERDEESQVAREGQELVDKITGNRR